MNRTVNKTHSFLAADRWDIVQQTQMTPSERWSVVRQLRRRVYGRKCKDVRACHATR